MPLPAPSLPLLALTLLLASLLRPRSHPSHTARECTLAPSQERVVVLGASSGVGEALALEYARRGARLCLVARRRAELERVREACEVLYPTGARERHEVLVVAMDISSPEDLVKLREVVEEAWSGLDTLHIISGLPSTQRLMALAAGPATASGEARSSPDDVSPSLAGLERIRDEARRVSDVNEMGVALAVAAFLPLLRRTSPAPLIHHLSSLAAVFPAPTRALYSATKAGGLAVFRTAAWEQPQAGDGDGTGKGRTRTVRFLAILPGTIDTAFRRKSASALEGHKPSEEYEKRTLTVEQTVQAILSHAARSPFPSPVAVPIPFTPLALRIPFLRVPPNDTIFLPAFPYRLAALVMDSWAVGAVRRSARRKYGLE